jgi:hypothetical protein
MDEYQDNVRQTMQQLNDDELIAKAASGTLTEKAQAIANEELNLRGLHLPLAGSTPESPSHSLADSFHLAYSGRLELWRVFWVGSLAPILAAMVMGGVSSKNGV